MHFPLYANTPFIKSENHGRSAPRSANTMTSLFLAAFFAGIMILGLRRPFLWVLVYLYVDIVAPQKISFNILGAVPISLIVFVAAFFSWLVLDKKTGARFGFRQTIIVALLAYCGFTTAMAVFPDTALTKWDWVWKALVFAAFLPLTLRTRLRLEAAVLVTVLSLAAIIISGGIKTVFGGGGYETLKLLVNDNTGLYESSIISTVSIAIIPVILWLMKYGTIFRPGRGVTIFGSCLIIACLLMPIGTAARTGLLCIGLLAVLILRTARHRFVYFGLIGAAGLLALPFLPASYMERMSTITAPAGDESASSRLAVWEWTLDYARDNPLGGGFTAYQANSFTYKMPVKREQGNTISTEFVEVTDSGRAYHSSYFEMLGEQGWPGLFLWLLLQTVSLIATWRLARRWRGRPAREPDNPAVTWQAPLAIALQQSHLVYLLGSLFVGIAFQPVIYILLGFQIALSNYSRKFLATERALNLKEGRQAGPSGRVMDRLADHPANAVTAR